MQICIHRKNNSPKPVNHHLTLKEGPKVKSYRIKRFPTHDILQVGFTLQTSTINNKRVISTFKFGCPHMTLKEGSRSNLTTSEDSQPTISYNLFSHCKPLGTITRPMQICIHRKDNSRKPVNNRLTLKEGPKVKSDHTTKFPAHDFV